MNGMETPSTTYSTSVNFNAPWHQLTHAWLGSSYSTAFYEPVKNSQVRDALQKIARETEEDYQNIQQVLIDLGVKVQRPFIDPELTIMDYVDPQSGQLNYQKSGSFTLIPKPPMQPRDCVLVVNNQLVTTNNDSSWFKENINCLNLSEQQISRAPLPFDAPLATIVGDCIIVDCREHPWLNEYFSQQFPDYKIKPVFIGGHNDAVFSLLKPGLLVSTYHHSNYTETLPGWTVKFIENQSWNAIPAWRQIKHSNHGKWWVPDSNANPEFGEFVNTWLGHWVGYVAETVFDVNLLQINDQTVLVNNYNKDMFDFFKQHNIEAIVTPFRHRFFWDGGIHCITNDIYRQGTKENYVKH